MYFFKFINAHEKFIVLEMKVVKIGGPVYRIGVGGGSASSVEVKINLNNRTFLKSIKKIHFHN